MAILFYKKKKREIYLAALAIILVLLLIFLWLKFMPGRSERPTVIQVGSLEQRKEKIQIDFQKLEDQILKDLQPFSPISTPQQDLGRENPFAPHVGTSTVPEF